MLRWGQSSRATSSALWLLPDAERAKRWAAARSDAAKGGQDPDLFLLVLGTTPHLLAKVTLPADFQQEAKDALLPKRRRTFGRAPPSALKAAAGAKDWTLRVHTSLLYAGILPPNRGGFASSAMALSVEFDRLVACEEIPVELRRMYALAAYTGLRPNELRALVWSDIDLEAGTISVSKSYCRITRTTNVPKTKAGSGRFRFRLPSKKWSPAASPRIACATRWSDTANTKTARTFARLSQRPASAVRRQQNRDADRLPCASRHLRHLADPRS